MSLSVDIYGSLINVFNPTEKEYIENWGTDDPEEQYWRRRELPEIFDEINYDDTTKSININDVACKNNKYILSVQIQSISENK